MSYHIAVKTKIPDAPEGLHIININAPKDTIWDALGVNLGHALATLEQYKSFDPSWAHLCPDGTIMRYHERIGCIFDLEYAD